ncbi:uncharacterized protein [Argopecten irradians]|uniref:uncharacterized protein n=1 Tax=Argopecten irradians TaxID=31199 RepID=UPI00371018B9
MRALVILTLLCICGGCLANEVANKGTIEEELMAFENAAKESVPPYEIYNKPANNKEGPTSYSAQRRRELGYTAKRRNQVGYTARKRRDLAYIANKRSELGYTARKRRDLGNASKMNIAYLARRRRDLANKA